MSATDRLKVTPPGWEDDTRMAVMFSPFREKTINPSSWTQKVKFWSEIIMEECKSSGRSLIDVQWLKDTYNRKGKSPLCFQTVLDEMTRKGSIRKLSDMSASGDEGWLSWGYGKLVKNPLSKGLSWLSQRKEENPQVEHYVLIEVIKHKGSQLLNWKERLSQPGLFEYSDLREQQRPLCASDMEFDLVIGELVQSKQVIVHEEGSTKYVKFLQKDESEKIINEKDLHIHRIKKTCKEMKQKIEALSTEITSLGKEAVAYKQQGMNKLAMCSMRKRRLVQMRTDKLGDHIAVLEDLLHKIQDSECNEMVMEALKGGTGILRDFNSRSRVDDVSQLLDDLADVSDIQGEITEELSTSRYPDEPSQLELEEELESILQESDASNTSIGSTSGVLDESILGHDTLSNDLASMLDDLQLPDVPTTSPSPSRDSRVKRKELA